MSASGSAGADGAGDEVNAMQTGSLLDADSMTVLVRDALRTTNAWDRLRGLLGRPPLTADAGLWITPCNSVHTAFMRYPIDLVFLDRQLMVIGIVHALPPWRMAGRWRAASTLELPAGMAAQRGFTPGLALHWRAHG